MNKLIKHIRRWNLWRKNCMNSKLHKILVLFGVTKSPTMTTVLLPEEIKELVYLIEEPIDKVNIFKN